MAEITVIGGINIDIEGSPFEKLQYQDSNPGTITLAYGGVGRNITENIARMGGDVAMVSVIGEDQMGAGAKAHLMALGVDTRAIETLPGKVSAMYLSVLDEDRDMAVGLCDMDIVKTITPDFLDKYAELLQGSRAIALDGNLDQETLAYAAKRFSGVPLFFDPVSSPKAIRAKDVIGSFSAIKPNIMEAEALSGIDIKGEEQVKEAGRYFLAQGVEKVFITLNKDGVYFADKNKDGFIRPGKPLISSATGAGDSFSAAILMGMVKELDVEAIARMGMAAAQIAMESDKAVNDNMSKDEMERRITNV